MARSTVILILVICGLLASVVSATDPDDYIIPGREYISDRSLSGLRLAYQTFDAGINDSSCLDCTNNRELIFLHAVTRIAILFIDNNSISINSFLLGKYLLMEIE